MIQIGRVDSEVRIAVLRRPGRIRAPLPQMCKSLGQHRKETPQTRIQGLEQIGDERDAHEGTCMHVHMLSDDP